jgi:hypothetical protein
MAVVILVDGSNFMIEGKKASLSRLERLVAGLRDECNKAGTTDFKIDVFVDASTRHLMSEADKERYGQGEKQGKYLQAPAGVEADAFILAHAETCSALVVTGDMYKKYQKQYPWVNRTGEGRMITAMEIAGSWTFMERHAGEAKPRSLREILAARPKVSTEPALAPPPPLPAPNGGYKKEITREYPHAMLLLVDQSGSMSGAWSGGGPKHIEVARILNKVIREIVIKCTRPEGVRDYVFLSVLGYGGERADEVRPLLPGTTLSNPFLSTSRANDLAQVEEVIAPSGRRTRIPRWIDPAADGRTPMCAALKVARDAVSSWVSEHPRSFPPIVMNLSDGESTDGSPIELSREISELRTSDGATLLFNACIASSGTPGEVLSYPSDLPAMATPHVRDMFEASSVVPEALRTLAQRFEVSIPVGGRGFVFNATIDDTIRLLNVGTPVATPKSSGGTASA